MAIASSSICLKRKNSDSSWTIVRRTSPSLSRGSSSWSRDSINPRAMALIIRPARWYFQVSMLSLREIRNLKNTWSWLLKPQISSSSLRKIYSTSKSIDLALFFWCHQMNLETASSVRAMFHLNQQTRAEMTSWQFLIKNKRPSRSA